MKKSVLLALVAASGMWVACENTIRYEYDRDDAQITILSQMYTSDTEHSIFLSMSYPDRTDSLPGATVVCWVGGEKFVAEHVPVPSETIGKYIPETGEIVTETVRHYQLFDEYRFSATIRPGDEVRVEASKGNLKAWAQVTAPQPASLVRVDSARVVRTHSYQDIDGSDSFEAAYMDLAATIRDIPGEDNYFFLSASSLTEGTFHRYDDTGAVDSTAYYKAESKGIDFQTFHDTILEDGYSAGEPGSLLEEILVSNRMHCFSDKAFRDGEAVVHPSFDLDYFIWRDYSYAWICPGTHEGDLHASFTLRLRTVDRDFYNYLRAINNLETYGYDVVPIIEPTLLPNNVTGGLGLVSVGAESTFTFDLGTRHIVHDPPYDPVYSYPPDYYFR